MRMAGYARVSTEKQAERYSIDAQKRILSEYAQREGHSLELFVDAGISGETIAARPEFRRLLREVEAGWFDIVLAVDSDRYSRASDLTDWQKIKSTFRKAGIRWGTPSQWLHENEFITDVMSAVSAEEKRKILARTMRGKLESIRKGKYPASNAPFGYRTENGLLLVHEPEAEVVRRMFQLALDGLTYNAMARRLTGERVLTPMTMRGGVRGGTAWQVHTVSRILTNRTYTGRATWGKRDTMGNDPIEVVVPRLIDQGMFDEVQRALQRNARFARRNDRDTYLLKGLMFCSCGRPMYGMRAGRGPYRYYRCQGYAHGECRLPQVRADDAEQVIAERVLEVLQNPKAVAALPDEFTNCDEALLRLDGINRQIARIPEGRSVLIARHAEGTIGAQELRDQLATLGRKKEALERERESLTDSAAAQASEELTARRLAELMAQAERTNVLRFVFTHLRWAGQMKTFAQGSAKLTKQWVEILRTVVRKVSPKADGTFDVEAVVLAQSAEVAQKKGAEPLNIKSLVTRME